MDSCKPQFISGTGNDLDMFRDLGYYFVESLNVQFVTRHKGVKIDYNSVLL